MFIKLFSLFSLYCNISLPKTARTQLTIKQELKDANTIRRKPQERSIPNTPTNQTN